MQWTIKSEKSQNTISYNPFTCVSVFVRIHKSTIITTTTWKIGLTSTWLRHSESKFQCVWLPNLISVCIGQDQTRCEQRKIRRKNIFLSLKRRERDRADAIVCLGASNWNNTEFVTFVKIQLNSTTSCVLCRLSVLPSPARIVSVARAVYLICRLVGVVVATNCYCIHSCTPVIWTPKTAGATV